MKESSNQTKFKSELLLQSENTDYKKALAEWIFVFTVKKENNCICGHHIIKNCVFKNKLNNKLITVGSSCVKKFFNQDYSEYFEIKTILYKYSGRLLDLCKERKIINDFEYKFIDSLPTYKKYSVKQTALFFKLHEKICLFLLKENINYI